MNSSNEEGGDQARNASHPARHEGRDSDYARTIPSSNKPGPASDTAPHSSTPAAPAAAPTSPDESGDENDTFHDAEDQEVRPKTSLTENGAQEEVRSTDQSDEKSALALPRSKALASPRHSGPLPISRSKPEEDQVSNSATKHGDEPDVMDEPPPPYTTNKHGQTHARLSSSSSASHPAITREKQPVDGTQVISEWSHQQLVPRKQDAVEEEEVEWQAMPAIDEFDVFDDYGRLVARGARVEDDPKQQYMSYSRGNGYTRVLDDEDARSATSMDEETNYLFKKPRPRPDEQGGQDDDGDAADDDDVRDTNTQLQATKDLLNDGQRIAYVGVVRLTIYKMINALNDVVPTQGSKKDIVNALENMEMWGQQMMVRLYKHMEITADEQLMIEQLAEHGLQAADLAPPLMQNARVKNPLADDKLSPSQHESSDHQPSSSQLSVASDATGQHVKEGEEVPEAYGPDDIPQTSQIELDIRWTLLCDLFLILLSDGSYDARSRRLLERVGSVIKISWVQICRFEKRVMDQLEMQETAEENWDESTHMEDRRKKGLKRKYMVMGLATVGGGLVIGLSAGLLAPVIGAGLAAGFTTLGVTGTAGFLGGVGGAALITSAATAAGGTIAVRASNRRTGHVRTFEYRPLHSNKRLNLILTVSGWMTGKVDDVRLPFSTVDPIMGDIYSLLWEPEMLRSMGDTINILATEALTQGLQQVLGSTILFALMASLQLPIVLTKLAYLIDNPWSVSVDRADAAGLILADSLMARHLGQRPITLVGFSLGSRLIFSCLKELASRGAYGVVQNVYLFGAPVVAKKEEWLRARCVIAGRFVNGYATNDWILGYLFRATSGGISRVAGLASVDKVPGLENMDVTELVNGHMAYRTAMPKVLRKVGWEVESDEFTEIEDPDPDNHAQRQRELIREIDEARKQAEEKPEKRRFGIFRRGKMAEKRDWETYDVKKNTKGPPTGVEGDDGRDMNTGVLFDIDAIRKELISEQIEIRELESTAPPMSFTTIRDGEKHVEYLRLPPEINAAEVAKMRLPPRPDEIDNGPASRTLRNGAGRTTSTPDTRTKSHDEGEFVEPKELVSTLPPLRLTSTRTTTPVNNSGTSTPSRPEVKKHDTEPAVGTGTGSSYISPELDHNAWTEEEEDGFGREKEVSMTFE